MAYDSRELLARVIQCEAGGEGENGMKAVATVIMNRVNAPHGEYQRVGMGNLRNVIYQQGQFDCVREVVGGRANMQTVYNMRPEQIHYDIADWALGGGLLGGVGDCLWYFNPYGECIAAFPRGGSGTFHTRVNLHCFYRPTELYRHT